MVFSTFADLVASPAYISNSETISKTMENESVHTKVVSSLMEGLTQPDVDKKLREDIENLNRTVKDIRKSFTKISGHLLAFDEERYHDLDGNVLELKSGWDELSRTFDTRLAASRDNASSAVGFLETYTAVMLTEVSDNKDIDELKEALKEFMDMVPEKQKQAAAQRESFAELAKEVQGYKVKIQNAVTRADEALQKEIGDAEAKKTRLQGEVTDIEGEMQALLTAIGVSTKVAGGAAICAVILISPLAAIIALGFAIDVLVKKNKYEQLRLQRDSKNEEIRQVDIELANLNRKLDALKRFKASMDDMNDDIDTLAAKIDGIGHIWGSLASDMAQFETNLDGLYKMKSKRTYNNALGVARKMYEKLCDLLNLYVKGALVD